MFKVRHIKSLSSDQRNISLNEKIDYLLGNTMFWLFILATAGVLAKLVFFPKRWDVLELALILFWRYIVERIKYRTDILLASIFVIVLSMPVLLAFNQPVIAGGFAIWIFYLLVVELVLNVRSIFRKA